MFLKIPRRTIRDTVLTHILTWFNELSGYKKKKSYRRKKYLRKFKKTAKTTTYTSLAMYKNVHQGNGVIKCKRQVDKEWTIAEIQFHGRNSGLLYTVPY